MADILDNKTRPLAYHTLVIEYRVTVLIRDRDGHEDILEQITQTSNLHKAKTRATGLFNSYMREWRGHRNITVVVGYFGKLADEPYRMAYGLLVGRAGKTERMYGGYDITDNSQNHGEVQRTTPDTLDNRRIRDRRSNGKVQNRGREDRMDNGRENTGGEGDGSATGEIARSEEGV